MKAVCLHGHFYQPPRENAWLDSVEKQDSAYPYHDWNSRITAECYGPNTASRILDPDGRIIGITNNFSRISFNVGPTLLAWMEQYEPQVYQAILEADRIGQENFGGHGTAIAQVYNHLIMPLANSRDKKTQIRWGVADFEHRFGRKPEGMWLAETAVDHETLECLVEEGISYTILAPRQASEVRPIGTNNWFNVSGGHIDPRRPYRCVLPSGRSINLFFYDGPIAQDLAFSELLKNGESFAHRLLEAFDHQNGDPQLVHVATDGETYGHHHRHGEMALAYALYHLEHHDNVEITVYGEYLELHPPTWEVRIHENSSWSCVHGVERWRADCGCNSGMHPGWHQRWRAPLREALDAVREKAIAHFEERGSLLFRDPWVAREDYISVILTPEDDARRDDFLARHLKVEQTAKNEQEALALLEIQRHAMLMYTSCGWFFDEISGIETTQILQYAARAIQLMRNAGIDAESDFLAILETAESNLPEHENGKVIYTKWIKAAEIDLQRIAAHAAITALFANGEVRPSSYRFHITLEEEFRHTAGKQTLLVGVLNVETVYTRKQARFDVAVLHFGDHNIHGGLRPAESEHPIATTWRRLREAFTSASLADTVLAMDEEFPDCRIGLDDVFQEEQRAIVKAISKEAENHLSNFVSAFFKENYQLIVAMGHLGAGIPPVLRGGIEFVLNRDLQEILSADPVDQDRFNAVLADIRRWKVKIHGEQLFYTGSEHAEALAVKIETDPLNIGAMQELTQTIARYQQLDIKLNLWYSQNAIHLIGETHYFIRANLARQGDQRSLEWVEHFDALAAALGVKIQ